MRILIIDDEPAVAGVIAEALQNEGNQVLIAGNGEEGLLAVERNRPDAVFLDIVMPDMDGTEVLRRIRETHPHLPVIVLSGWGTGRQLAEAKRLGATDVIVKPVALKHLTQALARVRKL